jgi:hypothetical protein
MGEFASRESARYPPELNMRLTRASLAYVASAERVAANSSSAVAPPVSVPEAVPASGSDVPAPLVPNVPAPSTPATRVLEQGVQIVRPTPIAIGELESQPDPTPDALPPAPVNPF